MSSQLRIRGWLLLLAIAIVFACLYPQGVERARAQSPLPTPPLFTPVFPTPAFPTPAFPTPAFPTPFGTPPGPLLTPTATPDFRIVNEITHPQTGDAVAGFAPIVGTAVITDFIQYQVHLSPSGAENWTWLATSNRVIRNGILHVLNTFVLEDGVYDLRVRAIRRDGNFSEAYLRRLEVRNANPPTPTPFVNELGTPQPASPLLPIPPQPPTPTPTPIFQSFVANGQGLFEPQNGDILAGAVPIIGTVNGKTYLNPFERYELYVRPMGGAEWGWLYTGDEQFWQTQIYLWDTTTLADGFYDLRLRIVYRDANYDEYFVGNLRIANQTPLRTLKKQDEVSTQKTAPGIYFPLDGAQVAGVMELVGTTAVPDLLRWELYWATAGSEDWQFLVSDDKPVVNNVLANLDLSLLPAGAYDFRLRIVRLDYRYSDYHVRNVQAAPPTPTPLPTAPIIRP
jgi:hypothetical protein